MSDKWTPGPWDLDIDEQRIDGVGTVKMERVVDRRGAVIAEFSNSTCNEIVYEDDGEGGGGYYDPQAIANARLISAAPDMAEALAELLKEVDKWGKLDSRGNSDEEIWIGDASGVVRVGSLRRARAALAKARGET